MQDLSDLVTEMPVINDNIIRQIIRTGNYDKDFCKISADYLEADNPHARSYLLYHAKETREPNSIRDIGTLIYRMLKMKGEVPRVTQKAVSDVEKEYEKNKGEFYAIDLLSHLKDKNPSIYKLVISGAKKLPCRPMSTIRTLTLFYRVFERQAELNKQKIN